jgi:cysteine desulfurase / selenocysteine lyase
MTSVSGSLPPWVSDESLRRQEFPVCQEKVYLAHAAVCPLPARVVGALQRYLEQVIRGGQFEYLHAAAEEGARTLAAQLLGAKAGEIAFIPSTSAGLSMVAAGLDWKPGDGVVLPQGDFPSNVHPWRELARRGVRVKAIPSTADGAITVEDVAAALDDRTRLVALSSVHYATGAWTDIDAVGAFLLERGVLFCVDAIQSFGALPLSVRNVDFLAADAHKWMLGPQGMGILFVRSERFRELHPPLVGWKSVVANKDFTDQRLEFPDTARRYEPGSLNALGIIGIHAALGLLAEVGIEAIASRLSALRARLLAGLEAKGYSIVGDRAQARPSGITSFQHRTGDDTIALHRSLDQRAIVTSLRDDPKGNKCIRIAPHFYTSDAEIESLLQSI